MAAGLFLQPWLLSSFLSAVESPEHQLRFKLIFTALWTVLLVIFAGAWWSLRQGKSSARAWAIAGSLASFVFPGIGTAAAIAGLIVFWRKDVVAKTAIEPEAPRLKGDGTSKVMDAVALGAYIVCVGVLIHLLNRWAIVSGLTIVRGGPGWLNFLIALQVCAFCHELGHVLAGWSVGMKLRHIGVGPVSAQIRSGKWIFKFKAAGVLGGGAAGMAPTDLDRLMWREAIMLLGGPLASLFCGTAAAFAIFTAIGNRWESWWHPLVLVAAIGWTDFIVNLMPVRPDANYSDGARLYQIFRRGVWADVEMAFATVSSTLVTPLRPRSVDVELLRRAAGFLQHGKRGLHAQLFVCMHYLDADQIDEASDALLRVEAIYPEVATSLEPDMLTELAFYRAICTRNVEPVRLWWQRFEDSKSKERDIDYYKGRAALLWLEGDTGTAHTVWEQGNAMAQRLPACGAYDFDRYCFELLKRELDAPVPSQAAAFEAAVSS